MPSDAVHRADQEGRYRIYNFTQHTLAPGARYAVRVGQRIVGQLGYREYWLQYQTNFNDRLLTVPGIQIHAGDPSSSYFSSQLLDLTPGTPDGPLDSTLDLGRMFSDESAGLHITPMRSGQIKRAIGSRCKSVFRMRPIFHPLWIC